MASERKAFKDYFDREAATRLAAQFAGAYRAFDRDAFVKRATKGLTSMEMGARVQQFSDALRAALPDAMPKALDILTRGLPPALPDCEDVTDGWLQWPLGQFIADHGVDCFDESMVAMEALTQRFSSEFAVRPFVEQLPAQTFAALLARVDHKSAHVRRWCSEGVRPRLPWGRKLHMLVKDPSPIWPILEALKDDDELYVRRSVANNLNDIAKDHPELVVKRCRAWSKANNPLRDWTISHGLRTLIKDGNPGALAVVGYGPPKKVEATLAVTPKRIAMGSAVQLQAAFTSSHTRAQDLLIDYVVHYVRQGNKTSGKVFKWTKTSLPAGGVIEMAKKHNMKPTTIRALYPGTHRVEVQVNGVRVAETSFRLTAAT